MGGARSATEAGGAGNPGLQGSDGGCHHAADGGADGVRQHTGGSCYGGDDSRRADGAHGLLPQCGGCLQDHQLGNHRALCCHAPDVACAGEDGRIGLALRCLGADDGWQRTYPDVGGRVLHHLADDDVYQQYGYGSTDGSDSPAQCLADRGKPSALSLCSNGGCEHVFCLAFLHTA